MGPAPRDARNVLLDAALELGQSWRRDVRLLADERLPELTPAQCAALAGEVEAARRAVEQWVRDRFDSVGGTWSGRDAEAADAYVRASFPWMDEGNVAHAVSQSTYYAWHG